jgi:NADPH-dependent 2,4-dienoyl-CoA reductase/sulfur reductase-like enzyme
MSALSWVQCTLHNPPLHITNTGDESAGTGYRGTLGTAILRAFNSTVGCTGLTEAAAVAAGMSATSVVVHGLSHAGYFPGAEPITLKAVYDSKSLRLLGGQAAGGLEGVDKRLDVIATGV